MKLQINGGQINRWIDIATEDGDPVCRVGVINTMGGYTKNWTATENRAAEIVKAVNEHAALVAVAEAAHAHAMSDPVNAEMARVKVCEKLRDLAAVRAGNGGGK